MNDAVERTKRLAFVRQQLSMYAGEKKTLANGTMICCPFHADKTPSGRIFHGESTLNPGYFKCYGCPATATWDELAPMLHLEPIHSGPPKDEHSMELLLAKHKDAMFKDTGTLYRKDRLKSWAIPKNKTWRRIPTNLLIELGGKMCLKWNDTYQQWGATKHIYLPVTINGRKVGYFRARMKKDESGVHPSYLLAGGQWSKTHGLWPFDYCIALMNKLDSDTVVIVEGQRDALRLLLAGIPAMCIFGTQSWSLNKCKLLEIAGVDRVISMMDGDDAGISATEKIVPTLLKMFAVKTLKLWAIKGSPYLQFKHEDEPSKAAKLAGVKLWDPENCPEWIIDKIKRVYFKRSN